MSNDVVPKKPIKSGKVGAGTVFDVRRPGRAPVSSTSKPVIVGHKPQVRDPFTTGRMNGDDPSLISKHKVDLKPVDTQSPEEKKEVAIDSGAATPELAAVAAELANQPAKPVPAPAPKPQPEPKPDAPAPVTDQADHSVTPAPFVPEKEPEPTANKPDAPKSVSMPDPTPASVTAPVEKKAVPMSPELKKEFEQAIHENPPAPEAIKPVISGGHGSLSFLKIALWFVSVIVLVGVVGDFLLDAGTITTSVSIPHTHFIKK